MPITVNIEGVGPKDFPDGTPREEIERQARLIWTNAQIEHLASKRSQDVVPDYLKAVTTEAKSGKDLYQAGDEKSFGDKLAEAFPEKPLIPAKAIKSVISPRGVGDIVPWADPVAEGLSNVISSLISPRSAGIMAGVAVAPQAALPAISAAFAPMMAGGAYESAKQAVGQVGQGEYKKAMTSGTEALAQGAMGVGAAAHAFKGSGLVKTPNGDLVKPNRPAGPELKAAVEAKLRDQYGATTFQEIANLEAAKAGAKPAEVTVGDVPVSESTAGKITLAPDADAVTVLHEVKHDIADQGKGPHPPEDNAAIAKEYLSEKRPLPKLTDNYRKPLSEYADTLFTETSPESALPLIPGTNVHSGGIPELWASNNPDLALGQGGNKGVLLEYGSGNLQGQVNRSKPTWELSYGQGDAEFRVSYLRPEDIHSTLKSVTVRPDAPISRVTAEQLRRGLKGWEQTKNADGSVTFRRPQEGAAIASDYLKAKGEYPPAETAPDFDTIVSHLAERNGPPGITEEAATFPGGAGRPVEIPTTRMFIYRNEAGEPIGVLQHHVAGGEMGEGATQLVVKEAHQGKGIATALMDAAKKAGFPVDELQNNAYTPDGEAFMRAYRSRNAKPAEGGKVLRFKKPGQAEVDASGFAKPEPGSTITEPEIAAEMDRIGGGGGEPPAGGQPPGPPTPGMEAAAEGFTQEPTSAKVSLLDTIKNLLGYPGRHGQHLIARLAPETAASMQTSSRGAAVQQAAVNKAFDLPKIEKAAGGPEGYERFKKMMVQEQLEYEKSQKPKAGIKDVMAPEEYAAAQADPAMQAAKAAYKESIEPVFKAAQQAGGGHLKGVETYFPLMTEPIKPITEATVWGTFKEHVRKSLGIPENDPSFGGNAPGKEGLAPGEFERTGLLPKDRQRVWTDEALTERLTKSYKFMGEVGFRQSLKDSGLAISLPADAPLPRSFPIEGKNVAIHVEPEEGGRRLIMPKQVWSEARKVLEKHSEEYDTQVIKSAMRVLTNIQLVGPFDFTFHNANQIGTIISHVPFLGKDPASIVIGATPLTRWAGVLHKISTEAPDPATLAEMAKQGLLSSRYGEVKGEIFGNTAVMKKLMYGPTGIEARARYTFYRAGQEAGLKGQALYEWTNQLGNYNFDMKSTLGRIVTRSGMGPFYEAGSSMLMNGIGAVIGKTGANSSMANVVGQQIGGGLAGQVATWALIYKGVYNKYPWEDEDAKFLAFPVSKDEETGDVTYLSMAALGPIPERGARAMGMRGAFETGVRGGNVNQGMEAGLQDVINALIHPVSGPAPEFGLGLIGYSPYVHLNQFQPSLSKSSYEKSSTLAGQAARNLRNATKDLVQFLSMADPHDKKPWWQYPADVVAPRLIQRGNPEKSTKRIAKERRSIEKTADEEESEMVE